MCHNVNPFEMLNSWLKSLTVFHLDAQWVSEELQVSEAQHRHVGLWHRHVWKPLLDDDDGLCVGRTKGASESTHRKGTVSRARMALLIP